MRRTPGITLALLLLMSLVLLGCGGEPSGQAEAASEEASTASSVEVVDETLVSDWPAEEPFTINAQPQSTHPRVVAVETEAPSAFVVIQNSAPTNPQELVRQLQQVLPKTQVVKQVQSPNPREVKLEVTNTKDVRALANKIPFAAVESINDRTRTITVDFDL